MIEGIKELGSELESHDFLDRENLKYADVRIRKSGPVVSANPAVAELSEPRQGKGSGI